MFKETNGDLWDQLGKVDAITIPVSVYTNENGNAMLGKGLGAQLVQYVPDAEIVLGKKIREEGELNLHVIAEIRGTKIISFPIRPKEVIVNSTKTNIHPNLRNKFRVGDVVPGIYGMPDSGIFAHSANLLYKMIVDEGFLTVAIPKMGSTLIDWETEILSVIEATDLANCENILVVTGEKPQESKDENNPLCNGDCNNCPFNLNNNILERIFGAFSSQKENLDLDTPLSRISSSLFDILVNLTEQIGRVEKESIDSDKEPDDMIDENGFLSYEDARNFVRNLNFKTLSQWVEYRNNNLPSNIPKHPNQYYKDQWVSWEDFLLYFNG